MLELRGHTSSASLCLHSSSSVLKASLAVVNCKFLECDSVTVGHTSLCRDCFHPCNVSILLPSPWWDEWLPKVLWRPTARLACSDWATKPIIQWLSIYSVVCLGIFGTCFTNLLVCLQIKSESHCMVSNWEIRRGIGGHCLFFFNLV